MSFSQGIRAVHSLSRRHVCKMWSAQHGSFPSRTARNSVGQPLNVKVKDVFLSSACCTNHSRLLSSDSRDTFGDDENSLKNDPEVKVWMSQIAQDFETAPFQDLVKNQPPSQLNQDIVDSASTDHNTLTAHESPDIEVEDFGYIEDDEDDLADPAPERSIPVSLERGLHGVFDVEEVVSVLDKENGVDIQVIDVPPEARFVDHMVLVSGKSMRHMRAMAASIEWLYKRKKKRSDRRFKLEGRDCQDWMAMDLGNIAVHIFTPEARQHYDLETLWTLGPEHDDRRHYVHDDMLNLSPADLFWLESGGAASATNEASPHHQTAGETLHNDADATGHSLKAQAENDNDADATGQSLKAQAENDNDADATGQSLKAQAENDQEQVLGSLRVDLKKEKDLKSNQPDY